MGRFFQFWLESLGQVPGVTRDVGLVSACAPPAPVRSGKAGEAGEDRGVADNVRELANDMAWGWALRFDPSSSRIRISM
jgi:hypothetical protein